MISLTSLVLLAPPYELAASTEPVGGNGPAEFDIVPDTEPWADIVPTDDGWDDLEPIAGT